ncbi:MAG: sialidase family protein, partial [Acidimicrobiia bacterium]
ADTVVGATIELTSGECRLLRSQNGGRGWELLDTTPSPPDFPQCFKGAVYGYLNETPIAWGRNGTLYWGLNGLHPTRVDPDTSVLVARSTNLGDTWSSTVVADARQPTTRSVTNPSRPVTGLAVDTTGPDDIVYVAWQTFPAGGGPREVLFSVSTDGGRTFSPPRLPYDEATSKRLGGEPGLEGLPPQLRVAGDGTLYILMPGRSADTSIPHRLLLGKSTDKGATFTYTEVTQLLEANSTPGLAWSPEGGQSGTLHIVYEDGYGRPPEPLGVHKIFYARSTDGGATFTPPKLLNDDDPAKRYSQFNPNVSVAPDGRVDVVWWDFRDGAGLYATDVYYVNSTDNGSTWSRNFRVTDRSIDRKVGTWSNNFDYRAPPSITSTDETALVGWDQTSPDEPSQDLMTAALQLTELPADNAAIPYVLAGLLGVATGGLILLAVARAVRRRGDSARQDAEVAEQEAARRP